MAALVATSLGATVTVIEKAKTPGGGTKYSHRGLRAAGSRFQEAIGISDTPEGYAEEITRRNKGESDPSLATRLAHASPRIVEFLADNAGVAFAVDEFTFGQSVRRSHVWSEDRPITDLMFDAALETSVNFRFSTEVTSLLQDSSGAVIGVDTDHGEILGRRVIVASGGFGASSGLLRQHIPKAVDIPSPGHPGSSGDAIRWGLELDATVENMGSFQPYPAHVGPKMRALPPEVIMSGGIMVDRNGNRFVDETQYPGGLANAMLDLRDQQACEIFDSRIMEEHREIGGERSLSRMEDDRLLFRADSARELATILEIDPDGLDATIQRYNSSATRDHADELGRTRSHPLEAPFCGIWVTVALYHTQGGLKINSNAQVLRGGVAPIPNLYAGGGAAVGLSGQGLDGYLPGNGLLASLGWGLIAAEHAVASL
jgi:fumarate reductase flavoprotein subunit